MEKKRIIIIEYWLELGGAERSLVSLLRNLDYDRYEVDLFLSRHSGELMDSIPKQVHLLPENPKMAIHIQPIRSMLPHVSFWGILLARLAAKFCARVYNCFHKQEGENIVVINYAHRFTTHFLPKIQKRTQYDFAISFLSPHYIGAYKVNAKKRAAWIHTDYSNVVNNPRAERKVWSAYDYIISISEKCTESFKNKFGDLGNQLVLVENTLDPEAIRASAEETADVEIPPEELSICSVGRFSNAKNFDSVPAICRKLVELGYPVRWYLVGFGPDEALIRQKIAEEGMQEHVIILGKKPNPYPYMKACRIYAQPSRYEGKAVTVREAQILCKPVIITDYTTAKSQLSDGYDGIIAPMETEALAQAIANLLSDEALQKQLSENCAKTDYSNKTEIEKLYQLME